MTDPQTTKKINREAFHYIRQCENWWGEMMDRRCYGWPKRAIEAAERQTEKYRIRAIKALGGKP